MPDSNPSALPSSPHNHIHVFLRRLAFAPSLLRRMYRTEFAQHFAVVLFFLQALLDPKRSKFAQTFGLRNQRAIRRLRTQCERAKRQLSTQTSVTIEFEPEKRASLAAVVLIGTRPLKKLAKDMFHLSLQVARL